MQRRVSCWTADDDTLEQCACLSAWRWARPILVVVTEVVGADAVGKKERKKREKKRKEEETGRAACRKDCRLDSSRSHGGGKKKKAIK